MKKYKLGDLILVDTAGFINFTIVPKIKYNIMNQETNKPEGAGISGSIKCMDVKKYFDVDEVGLTIRKK